MSQPPPWAFPFKGGCVSKPPLPYVSTLDDSYEFRGTSAAEKITYVDKEGETVVIRPARYYCCWIEAATHALFSDPYLHWFMQDYNIRWKLSGTRWICANPFPVANPLHKRYKDGVEAMAYFAARLRLHLTL